jgi:CheY-like chemotaxis protein
MQRVPHIIIVDDDRVLLEVCHRVLLRKLPNVQITLFEHPQMVLDSLTDQTPDLLITNQGMPGMSGLDLIRQIRAQGNPLPIILTSGDDTLAQRAQQAGANRFLPKPVSMQGELVEVIKELLGL